MDITKTAKVHGYIKASAEQSHPLQTKLTLILTDFDPNGNKQGVPLSEKDNIIKSALYTPIKINFNGDDYEGHDRAIPLGPITHVYETVDNGRDVIAADGVIWNDMYEDASEYLKETFSEGIGTSWEIYYANSEKDSSGTEWLQGCVFAGTCIVDTPAYGPTRTRLLAIAEKLGQDKTERQMDEEQEKAQSEDLSATRTDIMDAQDLLWTIYNGLDSLYNTTFDIEQQNIEKDITTVAETFAEKISKIAEFISGLNAKAEQLTSVQAELDTLKSEIAQAELEKAKSEKIIERKSKLSEAGINISADDFAKREVFYLEMTDENFDAFITDLQAVSGKKATSGKTTTLVPEFTGTTDNYDSLVKALRKR